MQKTYGLAIENPHGLVVLKLPYMSLEQAESARKTLSTYADMKGLNVLVVNRHAQ